MKKIFQSTAMAAALLAVFLLWQQQTDTPLTQEATRKPVQENTSHKTTYRVVRQRNSTMRQAVEQQADTIIAASTTEQAEDPATWFARLTPEQRHAYRQHCLDTETGQIRDLVNEHLDYHKQHQLTIWRKERAILRAMQAKCDRLRDFVPLLLAEQDSSPHIDPDTRLGELYLDLLALQEESGEGPAMALAVKHLMDPNPWLRTDARRFLMENKAIVPFFALFAGDAIPDDAELDRSQISTEQIRQLLEPLFAVVDCEAGLMDCGPGSFWALQQCRDYPRSCGMSPYEALHYNTVPQLMAFYDRIIQALRIQAQPVPDQ